MGIEIEAVFLEQGFDFRPVFPGLAAPGSPVYYQNPIIFHNVDLLIRLQRYVNLLNGFGELLDAKGLKKLLDVFVDKVLKNEKSMFTITK